MKKLLIIIFAILLINILGEFFYIFYLQQNTINSSPMAPSNTDFKKNATLTLSVNHAVNVDDLSMFTYWQKGVVSSASVNLELKGKIIAIATNGQIQEHGWPSVKYALKIRIEGENKEANDIFITPEELSKTEFKKQNTDSTSTSIDYKELKLNDEIKATLKFDLTKGFENNFIAAQIIKL